jgi:hypothetical protein
LRRVAELVVTLDGMYILTRRALEVDWDAAPMTLVWNLPWGIEGQAHFIGVKLEVRRP